MPPYAFSKLSLPKLVVSASSEISNLEVCKYIMEKQHFGLVKHVFI